MAEERTDQSVRGQAARLVMMVVVLTVVIASADCIVVASVDLSQMWSRLGAFSFWDRVSALLFVEGGIIAAIGALVGAGTAESEVARSLPNAGVTSGPEIQGRIAKERMEMRGDQLGFGLKAIALGLTLVALSLVVALAL